jgi:hypothetical protein
MGKKILFLVFFLIILVAVLGCEQEEESVSKKPQHKIFEEKAADYLDDNHDIKEFDFELRQAKDQDGKYDFVLAFEPKKIPSGRDLEENKLELVTQIRQDMRRIFQLQESDVLNDINMVIKQKVPKKVANPTGAMHILSEDNSSRVLRLATFNLSFKEYNTILNEYEDPDYRLTDFFEFSEIYLIETNLRNRGVKMKNVVIGEEIIDNKTVFEIIYEQYDIENFGSGQNYDDQEKYYKYFIENIGKFVTFTYESVEDIDLLKVYCLKGAEENRTKDLRFFNISGDASEKAVIIAEINVTKDQFISSRQEFDSFVRSDTVISPIFLLDLISQGEIMSLDIENGVAAINTTYDQSYSRADIIIENIEKDNAFIIEYIFDLYDIDRIILSSKIKIPAPDEVTKIDNVHTLLNDACRVEVDRSDYEALNTDVLSYKQIMYNLEAAWHNDLIVKNIEERFFKATNIRPLLKNIDLSDDQKTLSFDLDMCYFEDRNVERDIRRLAEDDQDKIEIYLIGDANTDAYFDRLFYSYLPPYLEEINVNLIKYLYDTQGQVTEEEKGFYNLEKIEDVPYWHVSEDYDEVWEEVDSDIYVDSDETLCYLDAWD